jgi:hypothetical protein
MRMVGAQRLPNSHNAALVTLVQTASSLPVEIHRTADQHQPKGSR